MVFNTLLRFSFHHSPFWCLSLSLRFIKISSTSDRRRTSLQEDPLIRWLLLIWAAPNSLNRLSAQLRASGINPGRMVILGKMHETWSPSSSREWMGCPTCKVTCTPIIQIRTSKVKPWNHCRNCASNTRCKEVQVVSPRPSPPHTGLSTPVSPTTTVL